MKKYISICLILSIIFFSIPFNQFISFSDTIIDYREENHPLEEIGKGEKPIVGMKLKIEHQDGSVSEQWITNNDSYDPLEANVGDTVIITDWSTLGSGSSLKRWDFQYYDGSKYNTFEKSATQDAVIDSFEFENEGTYEFYLSVEDNDTIGKYENWSKNGTHRAIKTLDSGIDYYMYFVRLDVNVSAYESPYTIADLTINPEFEYIEANGATTTMDVTLNANLTGTDLIPDSWVFSLNGDSTNTISGNGTRDMSYTFSDIIIDSSSERTEYWNGEVIINNYNAKNVATTVIYEEMPDKPSVDRADADLTITPKWIYETEHINFKGTVFGGFDPRYSIPGENEDGVVNKTIIIDEPIIDDALQRVYYYDYVFNSETGEWKTSKTYDQDRDEYEVKIIQPPNIVFGTGSDFDNHSFNVAFIGKPISILSESLKVNEPSVEHLNGFEHTDEWWEIIERDSGEIIEEGIGLLNDSEYIFGRNLYRPNTNYILRQKSYINIKPIRNTIQDTNFYIQNLPPQITITDSGSPYTKENFSLNIEIEDIDGYIMGQSIENQNNAILFSENYIPPNYDIKWIGSYIFTTENEGIYKFEITATDDYGATSTLTYQKGITDPTIIGSITINGEKKKENRVLNLDISNSFTNSPLGLDYSKTEWHYKKDGKNYLFNSDENIEKDNFNNILFKISGEYEFYYKLFTTTGFLKEFKKDVSIVKDQLPLINFSLFTYGRRINVSDDIPIIIDSGNGFFRLDDNSRSIDGEDILEKEYIISYYNNEYTTTLIQDDLGIPSTEDIVVFATQDNMINVQNLNNISIYFVTEDKELGNFDIDIKVTETNNQRSVFTSSVELLTVESNTNTFIDNKKPNVDFVLGREIPINLIIHSDAALSEEQNNNIDNLIKELEKQGYNVNLRKYENRW